jgi:hypothetical protein
VLANKTTSQTLIDSPHHSFKTRSGPAGRPGSVAGPGLSKKQAGNWLGQTRSTRRSTRDPVARANSAETRVYFFLYIYTHSWPKRRCFGLLQLKGQNEKSRGMNAVQKWEDLINFKPNSRNLQTHFSCEEEQRSRRLLNPWSLF